MKTENVKKFRFKNVFFIHNTDNLNTIELDNDIEFDSVMKSEIEWCSEVESIIKIKKINENMSLKFTNNKNILVYCGNNLIGGIYECSLWVSPEMRGRNIGKLIIKEYLKENKSLSAESFSNSGLNTCLSAYKEYILENNELTRDIKLSLINDALLTFEEIQNNNLIHSIRC